MKIDIPTLIACGIAPTQARQFAEPLSAACALFAIDSPRRIAGFVTQCAMESRNFQVLEEDLRYRDVARAAGIFKRVAPTQAQRERILRPLIEAKDWRGFANVIYAGVLGNGPPASGDGWRYRGRGAKQLTGRSNYAEAAAALKRPYLDQPDLVAAPLDACLTAAWFWHSIGGNALADAGQIDALTRKVNGPGMMAAADRRERYAEAIDELTAFA